MAPESELREQFVNTTTHIISAVQISPVTGAVGGSPVKPGQRVWMSKREQELTAQAPALDEDNVLANGKLVRVTDEDGSGAQRPLSYDHETARRKAALDAGVAPEPEAPAAEDAPPAPIPDRATMSEAPQLVNPPVPPHQPVSPPAPQPETAASPTPNSGSQAPRPVVPPANAAGTQAAGEEIATPAAAAKATDAQNAAAYQAAQRDQAAAKATATPMVDPSAGPGEGKGGQESSKTAPGGNG